MYSSIIYTRTTTAAINRWHHCKRTVRGARYVRARGFNVWTIFRWWGGSDPTDVNTLCYDEWSASAGSPSEFRLFPGFPRAFGLFFFFTARRNRARRVGPALNTAPDARAHTPTHTGYLRRYTLFIIFFFFTNVRTHTHIQPIACRHFVCCAVVLCRAYREIKNLNSPLPCCAFFFSRVPPPRRLDVRGGPAASRHDTGRAPPTGLCRHRRRLVRASSAGCARPSQIRRGVDNGRRRW